MKMKIRRPKKRMTELDIRMIKEELEAWGNKERGLRLSWIILERIFPFTRQTMYSKAEIRDAYENARIALKTGKVKRRTEASDLDLQRLKNRIKELELQVDEFQKLWISKKI